MKKRKNYNIKFKKKKKYKMERKNNFVKRKII